MIFRSVHDPPERLVQEGLLMELSIRTRQGGRLVSYIFLEHQFWNLKRKVGLVPGASKDPLV